jgi:hypothetical protein
MSQVDKEVVSRNKQNGGQVAQRVQRIVRTQGPSLTLSHLISSIVLQEDIISTLQLRTLKSTVVK